MGRPPQTKVRRCARLVSWICGASLAGTENGQLLVAQVVSSLDQATRSRVSTVSVAPGFQGDHSGTDCQRSDESTGARASQCWTSPTVPALRPKVWGRIVGSSNGPRRERLQCLRHHHQNSIAAHPSLGGRRGCDILTFDHADVARRMSNATPNSSLRSSCPSARKYCFEVMDGIQRYQGTTHPIAVSKGTFFRAS